MVLADGAQPKKSLVATVHSEGEVHVKQDHVDGLLDHHLQYVIGLGGGQYLLKSGVEQIAHGGQHGGIVISD